MSYERVIALIDMDCFYVQCEQRLAPELWSHPCAVAQYNNWKGGGLIAVNYEARSYGVKRGMRGQEAITLCPELHIFSVAEVRGKAELSRYREASAQVFDAIKLFVQNISPNIIVEKASIDEAFIDLTQYIDQLGDDLDSVPKADHLSDTVLEMSAETDLNQWLTDLRANDFIFNANEIRLALGALTVELIRREILNKTQFKCSAGISHNKMLSKLACALNKPNKQTLLPKAGVDQLFRRIDINKVRSLGGKLGQRVKELFKINTMFELKCVEWNQLAKQLDIKTAKWLKDLANGLDDEPVNNRQLSKSIGCGKNFPGKTALITIEDIRHWVKQLCEELVERISRDNEMNKRAPKLLSVGFSIKEKDHNSRSLQLDQYSDSNRLAEQVMKQVFHKMAKLEPIFNLSLSASKFVDDCDDPSLNARKLDNYFTKTDKNHSFNQLTYSCDTSNKKLKTNGKTLNDFWNSSTKSEKAVNCSDIEVIENNVSIDISNELIHNLSNNISNNVSNDLSNTITNNFNSKNDTLVSELISEEKPFKRGFFFRKMLELKAKERNSK